MREHREELANGMTRLGAEDAPWREALDLDETRRTLLSRVESLRHERNEGSKRIGALFKENRQSDAQALRERMSEVNTEIGHLDSQLSGIEGSLEQAMLQIPNMPEPDVPTSLDADDFTVIKAVGDLAEFDFVPKPHWDLGTQLGIIDLERGVKLAGSRQYLLRGVGARLQRALITWSLDVLVSEFGYEEVYPPFMVRSGCMIGTGNLPKFGDELFRDHEEDYWLIPTGEVPVTNMYRDEILDMADLPISHVANTPCFRREKVHAGKHARGIQRVHQFQKVEMVKFVVPEHGPQALEELTCTAETMLERLGLAYRRIAIPTGDLSFVAAKKYDLEIWGAGCAEWLEVSSVSWFRDFQARRAKIRYRPNSASRPRFVHTLNGSGLALPRIIIGILENFQRQDGSVEIPEVIRPYMGGVSEIRPD